MGMRDPYRVRSILGVLSIEGTPIPLCGGHCEPTGPPHTTNTPYVPHTPQNNLELFRGSGTLS